MPMPNPADPSMQPTGAAQISAIVAADSIASRCPNCGSGTTGIVNNEGDSRCHACGKVFKTKGLITDDQPFTSKVADELRDDGADYRKPYTQQPYPEENPQCPACGGPGVSIGQLGSRHHFRCRNCGLDFSHIDGQSEAQIPGGVPAAPGATVPWQEYQTPTTYQSKTADEIHDHGQNTDALPEADRTQQRDVEQEQDSSHIWQDDSGQPLINGQEYEMHSANYRIPDIVRVEQTKPDAVVVTTIGEYSNDPQAKAAEYTHEISRQEADEYGLTFTPSDGGESAAPDDPGHANTQPISQQPPQNDDHGQYVTHSLEEVEKLAVAEEQEEADHCPKCKGKHITSSMSSPETVMHECYRCGNAWETRDADLGPIDTDLDSRSWLHESSPIDVMPDDNFGIPTEFSQSRNLSDIAARTRQAGKKFSPREQRELIEEDGVARNSDLLDLGGTHYEEVEHYKTRDDWSGKANGYNVPDEHLVMGI